MLKAYLDASATEGARSGVFAVGGFVGTAEAWADLEERWKGGLETFGLNEFHLADVYYHLGHGKGNLCILHFSKIVGRSQVVGIGASCDIAHWKMRGTGYRNPYHFCFSMALGVLQEHVRLEFPGESVALVIDDDVQPHDLTKDIFAAYQDQAEGIFASLSFGNRRENLPIQCADLTVGALRKDWLSGLMSNNRATIREFFGAFGHRARFAHFSAETEATAAEAIKRFREEQQVPSSR